MTFQNLFTAITASLSKFLKITILFFKLYLSQLSVRTIYLVSLQKKTRKPDISSMSTPDLNKFLKQCKSIKNQLKSVSDNEDEEDFFNSMVNSEYYSINDFNKIKPDKSSSFGLAHVNIASLDAHIDDLRTVLCRLKSSFDVIAISEHKIRKDSLPSNNIEIQGYQEFDYVPTKTCFGGTGFMSNPVWTINLEMIYI